MPPQEPKEDMRERFEDEFSSKDTSANIIKSPKSKDDVKVFIEKEIQLAREEIVREILNKKTFYSVCSIHMEKRKECSMCKTGSYGLELKDVEKYASSLGIDITHKEK